uniref:Uroplakin 3B n=1 Tax=Cercocebus atys TaxID=9531 RepID=A0A2K5LZT1_CERAT
LGPAMGLSAGQSQLLMSLLLLLTHVQPGTGIAAPEHINYVPQLSNDTLAGRLTQSTFTLEQPLGQFHSHNISDSDTIWLVVALSNATQSFTAPRSNQDVPAPANFSQRGYYLTLRANRGLYPGGQARGQLRVLRVGNDTHCQPTKIGCNHPLPGPGPYRVKFLVMNDEGPVAETKWSSDTRLQQAQALQAVPGPQSPGTVVIIAILSILLAVLLTALLALQQRSGATSLSGPEETGVRR